MCASIASVEILVLRYPFSCSALLCHLDYKNHASKAQHPFLYPIELGNHPTSCCWSLFVFF